MTDTEHLMRLLANRRRLESSLSPLAHLRGPMRQDADSASSRPFTPDEINAAEIEAAREEGRRAGMMEAAQVAWRFNVCDPFASKIAAAIEAKAKEG